MNCLEMKKKGLQNQVIIHFAKSSLDFFRFEFCGGHFVLGRGNSGTRVQKTHARRPFFHRYGDAQVTAA